MTNFKNWSAAFKFATDVVAGKGRREKNGPPNSDE